ncbi:MAG: hypothetical protein H6730_26885 [Deltaproteobacteria bacterium]|nr:hypothetical protein [Deltaproteobacteria bacterium]
MRLNHSLLFTTGIVLLPAVASAAPDLFGREGLYDMTGDPRVEQLRPELDYITGKVPTYAERLGRVGAATVEVRPNYVYVEDNDNSFPIPFQSGNDLQTAANVALRELYRVLPDEFVFVYMFTSFNTNIGAFFYAPEANDTWGINAQGIFDSNGPSPREGFVFMNDWKSFEEIFGSGPGAAGQARSVFNQEAGHRWGSFVTTGPDGNGAGADVLLGRDDAHWSYFMHTGGSPMEGNNWRDNQDGTFTTVTGFNNWHYSDLDLYLMGLLPMNEVEPFFVITNPDVGRLRDLFGDALNKASTPQIIQPVTISGTRVDLTMEDVRLRNGSRSPAHGEAPTEWRVAFVMLASSSAPLNESEKAEFDTMVEDYVAGFHEGTRDRGTLNYLLRDPEPPKSPVGGACTEAADCDPEVANFCVADPTALTSFCTASCDTASTCPVDWCCAMAQDAPVPVCLPAGMCPVNPTCACDADPNACDEGCACDAACGNSNNNSTNNNTNNGNNNGGGGGTCGCDLTYSCDMDGNVECACDRECGGCGCTESERGPAAPAAASAAALALLYFAGRRRRRSP